MKTVVHKRMLVSVEEEVFKELNLKEAQEVTEETFWNIIQLNSLVGLEKIRKQVS